jgi:hypothetical protein
MLEWRSNQEVYGKSDNNRNASVNYLCEDRPEAESKAQEEAIIVRKLCVK